jgi:hypothetical protein
MRFLAALILTTPLLASASPVDGNMDALITTLGLGARQAEAQAACERDVPGSVKLLHDPSIARYCLVRHGAPRKQALFLGVQLSAEFAKEGRGDASDAVDKLVDVLEQRTD